MGQKRRRQPDRIHRRTINHGMLMNSLAVIVRGLRDPPTAVFSYFQSTASSPLSGLATVDFDVEQPPRLDCGRNVEHQ